MTGLCGGLAMVALWTQQLPVDTAIRVGRLDNGLQYAVRVNHEPQHRAELRLVVNAGSVLEDDDQQGLAHYVEHMAFNGTSHFPRAALVNYLEGIGMRFGPDLNASTGFDETIYQLTVPTDSAQFLEQAFQILEDWAHEQVFEDSQVDRERGVIIEEWRLGRGAGARMQDRQLPILFRGSRYADRLPIGKKEHLDRFDHAALRRFYADWYRPDLMAVVAVGDFDAARVEALIRERFAGLVNPAHPRPRGAFPVPDNDTTLYAVATDREATRSIVNVYYKLPARERGTVPAWRQLLVERLYNGMLNQRFFELTQAADPPFLGAFSGGGQFVRAGEIYSLSALVRDGDVPRGLEALLTEAQRAVRFGFSAAELERQKRQLLRGVEQMYAERAKTGSASYADDYVGHFTQGSPLPPGIAWEYEHIQGLVAGITLADVNAVAPAWVTERNRVVLVSAPDRAGLTTPGDSSLKAVFAAVQGKTITARVETASDVPLVAGRPAPAAIVRERMLPEVGMREWRLANGVRVLLKPTDFKDDEVLVGATSPGGESLAPDSLATTATFAAALVGESGVGPYDATGLERYLAGRAVYVRPTIESLTEGFGGSASPKDLETLFQLIYAYFTAPRLDSSAFLSTRAQLLAAVQNRGADPGAVFNDTLQVTLHQHHARWRPLTTAVVGELRQTEALAFYRDRFADAGDFTFVFVGSFNPDSLKPLVQSYLGILPARGRRERWRDDGDRPPAGVVRRTVRKGVEPKSRTQIIFTGALADTRENRYTLRSMVQVLDLMLRDRLREDLGGTYGVNVGYGSRRFPRATYSISIGFGAAPERLDSLVQVVFQQIDTLRRVGPSAANLAKVRESQRRGREVSLRQNGYWLGQILARVENGATDFSDLLTYEQLIDGLTAEQVRAAAGRLLRPDHYVQVSLYPEQP